MAHGNLDPMPNDEIVRQAPGGIWVYPLRLLQTRAADGDGGRKRVTAMHFYMDLMNVLHVGLPLCLLHPLSLNCDDRDTFHVVFSSRREEYFCDEKWRQRLQRGLQCAFFVRNWLTHV